MMPDSPVSYAVGVVAVALDSLLSGFATVYFEKVLKTTVLTVWDRNLQLAFYSMLIYGPCAQLVERRRLGSVTARRLRLLGRTRQGCTGCWAALCTPGERL